MSKIRERISALPGARLCPKDQPQHPRMRSRGETTSRCRSRQSLRLVLRTQPRFVSQRFSGAVPRCAQACGAHLGTTTGSRLCPKDQPQQVRMPRVAELSENAWPRRAAAAGAPHTAAVRSRAFGGGIKMRPPRSGRTLKVPPSGGWKAARTRTLESVRYDFVQLGCADTEGAIFHLPAKEPVLGEGFMHPF